MAKLDRILLKHSAVESENPANELNDFKNALINGGIEGGDIEPGEVVLRRGKGFIEMWALDFDEAAQQLSVDIGGVVPAWDPANLDNVSLDQIGDVSYSDGISGELGSGQAGYVLTWDGLKWVVRPPAGQGEFDGLIPSLNDVGDVNYAFYASASSPKYNPEQGDVLIWDYNYQENRFQWAPVPLAFENLAFTDVFSSTININRGQISRIQFGLVNGGTTQAGLFGSSTNVGINLGLQSFTLFGGGQQSVSGTGGTGGYAVLKLKSYLEIQATYTGQTPGIRWAEAAHPGSLPSDLYVPSLRHVREDFQSRMIGELSDVDDTGVQNGYVLVWDEAALKYVPGVGPAPDLANASIDELQDVNTAGKSRGIPLAWDPAQFAWTPQSIKLTDLTWDNFTDWYLSSDPSNHTTRCRDCNANNLGRITVKDNVPYICLQTRNVSTTTTNNRYGYVRMLHDGYNRTDDKNYYAPTENRTAVGYAGRTDVLSSVAYEGTLGALYNVSTANVFAGACPIYNPSISGFEMGYPALNLSNYSIGQLGDVDASGAGEGYGLLWSGSQWVASTLDQKFRIDDMQDVQFGSLGVENNKLVAAYMLIANPQTPAYQSGDDVSQVLAVSTAKGDAQLGTTSEATSPLLYLYGKARYFGTATNWTLAQKLDNYVRWNHEPSWQEIDGDGCIELFFYCNLLLEDRTLFRKVANAGQGGYLLRLKQNGALEWTVNPPTGQSGFFLTSAVNSVSLNNWHHVAVTKQGNTQRLYLDGYKISQTIAVTDYTGDGLFVLGRNDLDDANTLTHNFWRGYMLDLRVTRGRAKYTGSAYTVPYSIGQEIIDTTPQSGDFLSYDGTKWTNVSGVTADISSNSITELSDVDTTTQNPGTGDALVWTGTKWEPGIPGIGATWELADFTDVSTNYTTGTPNVRLDQADLLTFSILYATPGDLPYLWSRPTNGLRLAYYDASYTCGPGGDGPYTATSTVYFDANKKGQATIRAERVTILNKWFDCQIVSFEYHEDALHYEKCPDRSYDGPPNGYGDIPGNPEETYIPCWGVIQDHMNDLLPYGQLKMLGDVSEQAPTLGQALAWDGNQWAPASGVAADISNNSIADLADVQYNGTPSTGYVLTWDGSHWAPVSPADNFWAYRDFQRYTLTSNAPINSALTLDQNSPVLTGTNTGFNDDDIYDIGGGTIGSSTVIGGRGFSFHAVYDQPQTGVLGYRKAFIYGGRGVSAPTIITSGMSGTTGSWIEIGSTQIRVADNGGTSNGTGGFSLSGRWKFRYEDGTLDWIDFANDQVPNKRGITTYVDAGLASLDLNPNSIDDLGNVDTSGKLLGWALTWDGNGQWVATSGVAADISQASIGGLLDVDKYENTSALVNNAYLTFDVGQLRTTRPWRTGGGLELRSVNTTGLIGWSPTSAGSPLLQNTGGIYDTTSLTIEPDGLVVNAPNGVKVNYQPSLGDTTLPTWLQVRQEIARTAVDYQALFLLGCNTTKELVYDWPLQVGITTSPNPVFDSRFPGNFSFRFDRTNKDRIQWLTANGAVETWTAAQLWSVEFFIKIQSGVASDGLNEYVICPVTRDTAYSNSERYSNGLHIYLVGTERNRIALTLGRKDSWSVGSHDISGTVPFNEWVHVYAAHEGGNNVRLYLDGDLKGTKVQTSSWTMAGGWSIGGRTQPLSTSDDSYLNGQLDDLRITRGWVPYGENTNSVPVPVEPLTAGASRFVFGTLSQLEDVNTVLVPPVQGDVLIYDAVNGYWKAGAAPPADIGTSVIGQLADVTTTNSVPDQDDILAWSAINQDWRRTKIDGNGGVRPLIARTVAPGVVPSAGSLYAGELFLNMADRKMYSLDDTGVAFTFATDSTLAEIDEIDGGTY